MCCDLFHMKLIIEILQVNIGTDRLAPEKRIPTVCCAFILLGKFTREVNGNEVGRPYWKEIW